MTCGSFGNRQKLAQMKRSATIKDTLGRALRITKVQFDGKINAARMEGIPKEFFAGKLQPGVGV